MDEKRLTQCLALERKLVGEVDQLFPMRDKPKLFNLESLQDWLESIGFCRVDGWATFYQHQPSEVVVKADDNHSIIDIRGGMGKFIDFLHVSSDVSRGRVVPALIEGWINDDLLREGQLSDSKRHLTLSDLMSPVPQQGLSTYLKDINLRKAVHVVFVGCDFRPRYTVNYQFLVQEL